MNFFCTEKCKKILFTLLSISLGFLLCIIYISSTENFCRFKVKYVNKEFACEERPAIKKHGYAKLQDQLETYISNEAKNGAVSDVAFYFRDLENGPVFGINEYEDFAPASLLKLPVALIYFQQAEEEPGLLSRKIEFHRTELQIRPEFKVDEALIDGASYTIEELIRLMLVNSDNDAANILYMYLVENGPKDIVKNSYLEYGIIAPRDSYDKVISVRRFASILRGIYNASLVDTSSSEKLLGWLTLSKFDSGIEAGVPQEVEVAHKFGERILENGNKHLHDCGIVYYPENPYLVCIMTQGGEFSDLARVISDISRMVYAEVDSRRL